jgi:hypothetical protein
MSNLDENVVDGFGKSAPTVPVVDGKPGEELEVDTGWVVTLAPNAEGKRRRMRAWIFTPNVSRYRFVWPTEEETTAAAIAACEAAWDFYGGIFRVLSRTTRRRLSRRRMQSVRASQPRFSNMPRSAVFTSTRRVCAARRTRATLHTAPPL